MRTPTSYSTKKRVRSFEKEVLKRAYAAGCEPGDHLPECAESNRYCPFRD